MLVEHGETIGSKAVVSEIAGEEFVRSSTLFVSGSGNPNTATNDPPDIVFMISLRHACTRNVRSRRLGGTLV